MMETTMTSNAPVPARLPVARIVNCDWGTNPKKRWMVRANWQKDRYRATAPELAGDLSTFLSRIRGGLDRQDRLLVGFDFPIGFPVAYAQLAGIKSFREGLLQLGIGAWSKFYDICEAQDEISLRRPFYPYRPGSTKRAQLIQGFGVDDWNCLLRLCERQRGDRTSASPLFWTLGGKQVGRAAISGWRDVLVPALRWQDCSLGVWPFDGSLKEVLGQFTTVVAETYPAEAYRHLGFLRNWKGKRNQDRRRERRTDLTAWAKQRDVDFDSALISEIDNGFGSGMEGEDQFDSVVGLCSMIDVVLGHRTDGTPGSEDIRKIEGWILGQQVPKPGGTLEGRRSEIAHGFGHPSALHSGESGTAAKH